MEEKVDSTLDRLLVEFGKEILAIVPGRVSTEVDARFSFDIQGSITKALHIIDVSMLLFPNILMASADKKIALQIDWHRQVSYSDQTRQHMGGCESSS